MPLDDDPEEEDEEEEDDDDCFESEGRYLSSFGTKLNNTNNNRRIATNFIIIATSFNIITMII